MQTVNERIDLIIAESKMTKTAFAESLKVSQQYISKLVKTGTPSERLLDDICEKIIISGKKINIDWLRTGEGDMFVELPPEDEVAAYVSELLEDDGSNPLYKIIIETMRTYSELSPKSQEVFREFAQKLVDNLQKEKEG